MRREFNVYLCVKSQKPLCVCRDILNLGPPTTTTRTKKSKDDNDHVFYLLIHFCIKPQHGISRSSNITVIIIAIIQLDGRMDL
jgi:hypothetical protein